MKEIQLTQGKTAVIDDEDFQLISKWKWRVVKKKSDQTCYAMRRTKENGKHIAVTMHRAIMNPPKGAPIDHIDGDGLNNRRSNLRVCTHAQNCWNRKHNSNAKNRFKGVYKKGTRWESFITTNRQKVYLGSFETDLEAALAYNIAATKYFGDFAKLNIV